jgi:hypothetical protein
MSDQQQQPDFWGKFGSTFDEVNQRLRGLPQFLRGVAQQINTPGNPINEIGNKIAAPVNAALGGAANMIGMGLPRQVIKLVAPGVANTFETAEQAHPIAAGIGQGAGLAGSLIADPAAIAGKAVPAATLGGRLAKNALTSALYSVPAAGAEALDTGDVGSALKHGAVNTGLGTLLGAGIESATPRLQKILNGLQAKGMGLNTADITQSLKGGAAASGVGKRGQARYASTHADDLIQNIVDLGNEMGGRTKAGKEKILQWVSDGYKKLGDAVDSAGQTASSLLTPILSSPHIQQAKQIFNPSDVDSMILDTVQKVDNMGWQKGRIFLGDIIRAAKKVADPTETVKLKGSVAQAIHDSLGDVARQVGGDTLDKLDGMYGASRSFNTALSREERNLPTSIFPGSDTAPRMGIMAKMVPGILSGAGMAAAGDKPQTPQDWLPYLGKIAAATAGGQILNRGLSKAANVGLGAAARVAPEILKPNIIQNIIPRLNSGKGGQTVAPISFGGQPGAEVQPGAQPGSQATTPQLQATAVSMEKSADPQSVETAKSQLSDAYKGQVERNIRMLYSDYVRSSGGYTNYSYEDFANEMAARTDNFRDPIATSYVMFYDPAEQKNYLKSYNALLDAQRINIGQALQYTESPVQSLLGGRGAGLRAGTPRVQEQSQYNALSNMISKILNPSDAGKALSKDQADKLNMELNTIRRLPAEQQQGAFMDLLERGYGVDLPMLRRMGLV